MWLMQNNVTSFVLSYQPESLVLTGKVQRQLRKQTSGHHVVVECIFSLLLCEASSLGLLFVIFFAFEADGIPWNVTVNASSSVATP
jgi:hypothetical protein